jgi:NADH pyrophosphatase NudC (nudix superfamily)
MKYCPKCGAELKIAEIDGVERSVCSAKCGYIHWNNPIPVAAALVQLNGKYILARNAQWPKDFFSLISGFIEAGESPEKAIERETLEELNLTVESANFIGHYPFPEMNQLMIVYLVQAKGQITLSAELAEYKLLTEQELIEHDFGVLRLGRAVVEKCFS